MLFRAVGGEAEDWVEYKTEKMISAGEGAGARAKLMTLLMIDVRDGNIEKA